jgi:hypothetical protein
MLVVERGTRDRADTDDGRLGERRDARRAPKEISDGGGDGGGLKRGRTDPA